MPTMLKTGIVFFAALVLAITAPVTWGASATWTVLGQQGLVRFVIVPVEQAAERAAFEQQIGALCEPERTCFLNFYTNSTRARAEVPLPDAISNEATATYRRSMKNGVQIFMWSCRMKIAGDCF
jgi:hypothetical protein